MEESCPCPLQIYILLNNRWVCPLSPFGLFSSLSPIERVTSVCFFFKKRTIDKLPFAWWTNGKWVEENCLAFHFQIVMAAYMYIYAAVSMYIIYGKWNWQKTATSICLQQTENGNGKLPLVCSRQKCKIGVCLPWSATINGNRQLLFQKMCPSGVGSSKCYL